MERRAQMRRVSPRCAFMGSLVQIRHAFFLTGFMERHAQMRRVGLLGAFMRSFVQMRYAFLLGGFMERHVQMQHAFLSFSSCAMVARSGWRGGGTRRRR